MNAQSHPEAPGAECSGKASGGNGDFQWAGIALALLLALVHGLVFYPGLVSWDTHSQLEQVFAGQLSDHHPPVMTAVLWWFLRHGPGWGALFFLQEALVWMALAALARELIALLPWRVPPRMALGLVALVLALYALPLAPFTFHAALVGRDTWFLTALFWALALFLKARRAGAGWSQGRLLGSALLGTLCFALAVAFRYNAVVLLPLAGLALVLMVRGRLRWAWLWAGAPLLLFFGMSKAVEQRFAIEQSHLIRYAYAFELISLEAAHPGTASAENFVVPYLKPGFREHFVMGHLEGTPFRENEIVERAVFDAAHFEALKGSYFTMAKRHPLELASVKARIWLALLGSDWSWDIVPGSYQWNPFAQEARWSHGLVGAGRNVLEWIAFKRVYRPLVLGHVLWLGLNLLLVVAVALPGPGRRLFGEGRVTALVLLLFPLGYAFSYLVACLGADYRYLMPSTVPVQMLALLALLAGAGRRFAAGSPARAGGDVLSQPVP